MQAAPGYWHPAGYPLPAPDGHGVPGHQNYPPPLGGYPPPAPYGHAAPGQPIYAYPPPYLPYPKTDGVSVAALVTGILSVTPLALFTAIPAIICGAIGLGRTKRTGSRGRGLALTGVILGTIALLFWGLIIAVATSTGNFSFEVATPSGTTYGASWRNAINQDVHGFNGGFAVTADRAESAFVSRTVSLTAEDLANIWVTSSSSSGEISIMISQSGTPESEWTTLSGAVNFDGPVPIGNLSPGRVRFTIDMRDVRDLEVTIRWR